VSAIVLEGTVERSEWEDAYRTAFPRVYRGLVALGAHAEEAEDALHDAFMKGLTRPERELTSIEGWIFVVASRSWRRRRIRDRVLLPWTILRDVSAPAPSSAMNDILSAVRALPLRQRQVVVARYIVGLSQLETADLLGISRGTVSATATQATAALRERLEDSP
jgi:RNA polymerase sigma factor (sigma-70 family)